MLPRLFFSFFAKLVMLITTIRIITIEVGMLGTIFGIYLKELQFSLKGPGITPI